MYLVRSCAVALLVMWNSANAQELRPSDDCAGLEENSAIAAIRGCHGEVVDPAEAALLGEGPVSEPPFFWDESYDRMSEEAWASSGPRQGPTLPSEAGGTLPPLPRAAPATGLVQIDGETWASDQQRDRTAVRDAAASTTRNNSWGAPPRLVPLTPIAEPHIEVDGLVVPMEDWLKRSPLDTHADPVNEEATEGDLASPVPLPSKVMRSAVIDGVTVELDAASYLLMGMILRSAGTQETEEAQTVRSGVETELSE
jgi:hypothetical protein